MEYNTGEWVSVENLGELRKALMVFPDSVDCKFDIRFLETIDTDSDGRSTLSIQLKESEITGW